MQGPGKSALSTVPLCFQLLGSTSQQPSDKPEPSKPSSCDTWFCPQCGGPMVLVETLTAVELQLRSPPKVAVAA